MALRTSATCAGLVTIRLEWERTKATSFSEAFPGIPFEPVNGASDELLNLSRTSSLCPSADSYSSQSAKSRLTWATI